MASFNQVTLMGNLTRDPQVRSVGSGTTVAEFGIAMNRKFKTQSGEEREEVTFVDVSAWGRTGELIQQYYKKGAPIFFTGRLKYDQWEDKSGGGKRSKLTVVVDDLVFLPRGDGGNGGGRSGGGEGDYDQRPQQQQQRGAGGPQRGGQAGGGNKGKAPQQPFGDDEQFKDDDIPF